MGWWLCINSNNYTYFDLQDLGLVYYSPHRSTISLLGNCRFIGDVYYYGMIVGRGVTQCSCSTPILFIRLYISSIQCIVLPHDLIIYTNKRPRQEGMGALFLALQKSCLRVADNANYKSGSAD